MPLRHAVLVIVVAVGTAGCSLTLRAPIVVSGQAFPYARATQLRAGMSSQEVESLLGTPLRHVTRAAVDVWTYDVTRRLRECRVYVGPVPLRPARTERRAVELTFRGGALQVAVYREDGPGPSIERALVRQTDGVVKTLSQANDTERLLLRAVKTYVEKGGDHETPVFRQAFTDLDDDHLADAIVLLSGTEWCGSGGCTMLVFRGTKSGFTFVSSSTITNEPIRVSTEKSHGWRNLIVNSKGKGDVLMRFEGQRYPLNPSMQPKATAAQVRSSQIVLK